MEASNNAGHPFLVLKDAVVRRAGKEILHIDAFELSEGQSLAILGPNGSGKSSFIKLITREFLPLHRDEPAVLFRGAAKATLAEVRSCLGIISSTMQDQITVHLPAIEVVIGGLYGTLGVPRRIEAGEAQRLRALEVMEELGIADMASRDIMTLSTGQARRVLVARALVSDPDVLVLDEPCCGLDPSGMYHVRRTMRELVRTGRAIVLVTHYPEDIIPEIGRLVLLKDGRIFADGRKEDLLDDRHMQLLFEAPFKVVECDGRYALRSRD